VIGTEGVLETRVSRAGVDEEAVTNLADVPKALNGGGVEGEERGSVEPDVVPEWVADDLSGAAEQRVGS
jgi:hypothetical protein